MRLPWISRRQSPRANSRRQRTAPLRVRRLERRRVLDASISDLIFAPPDIDGTTAVHDTNEGTEVTATADAAGQGTLHYEWTLTKDANVVAEGFDPAFTFTPLDDGDYSVALKVTDDAQLVATRTESVVVHNVDPVLVVAPDQMVDEGELLDLSAIGAPPLGLFIDDGVLDTHTVTVNWGDSLVDETPTLFGSAGSFALGGTHTYADNGVYTVTVNVVDDDGGSDTESFSVTVKNVAPTATFGNNGPVDEGSSAIVSFSGQFDPGTDDTAAGFGYAYDLNNDGTFDFGDGTYAGSVTNDSQMVTAALLADGPGTRTVRAWIIDKDDEHTEYLTDIVVDNVPPELLNIVILDDTINEGDTATITMTINDPGAMDVFEVDVDWKDGGPVDTIVALGGMDVSGTIGGTNYEWDGQSRELKVSHLYPDDNPTDTSSDMYAVALTVRDDDLGMTGPYTVDLIVNNVRPVLVVAPDQMVNEGSLLDLSARLRRWRCSSTTARWTLTQSRSIGVTDRRSKCRRPIGAAGSFVIGGMHTYADNGDYDVTVTVTDDDGGMDMQTFTVTVNNVAPVLINVDATDATIDEGESAEIMATISDPGKLDTFDVDVNWKDGGPIDTIVGLGSTDISGTAGSTSYVWDADAHQLTVSHLYPDDNPTGTTSDLYVVELFVQDNYPDQTGPYNVDIRVANVRPVLVVAPDQMVFEGSLLDLSAMGAPPLALFIDDGVQDTHTVTVDWGDGSIADPLTLFGSAGSFAVGGTHTYADNDTYEVTVTVTDDDGGTDTQSFFVTVKNANPVIDTRAITTPINENESATLSGTYSDPGVLDTHELDIDWNGDNVFDQIVMVSGGTFSVDHQYLDDDPTGTSMDTFPVNFRLRDDDGGSDTDSVDLTVKNVPPVLVVAPDQMVFEGSLLDLSAMGAPPLALFIDDGTLDTHTVTVDWGDGSIADPLTLFGSAGSFAVGGTHTYADNGTYIVTVTVTDDDTGSDTKSFSVMVENVPPTLTLPYKDQMVMVNEGSELTLVDLGTITDPGFRNDALNTDETFTYSIDWGDGTVIDAGTATIDDGGGVGDLTDASFDGMHTYADNDTYTVTVRIADDDMTGNFATGVVGIDFVEQTFSVTVKNVNPTLIPTISQTVDEGSELSITNIGTITDPGFQNLALGTDELFDFWINWGDGTAIDMGSATIDDIGGVMDLTDASFDGAHTFADNGLYTVMLRVADDDMTADFGGVKDLDFVEQIFTVTVNNVNPMLTGVESLQVDEGTAFTLTSLGVKLEDPGFDNLLNTLDPNNGGETQETFTAFTINWGDGQGTNEPVSIDNMNDRISGSPGVTTKATLTHDAYTYADNGKYNVTITFMDDDGPVVAQTFEITVRNVVPTLELPNGNLPTGNQTIFESQTIQLTNLGAITDPGFDNPLNPLSAPSGSVERFRYFVDWGDGMTTPPLSTDVALDATIDDIGGVMDLTDASFDGAHTYADNGMYTVKVRVADDDMAGYLWTAQEFFSGNGENTTDQPAFVEQTFTITVRNLDPAFVPQPDGASFQGDEINTKGITTIRVMYSDPGYDNPFNTFDPLNGGETVETFNHVVQWGDGTVDAIHQYTSGGVFTVDGDDDAQ